MNARSPDGSESSRASESPYVIFVRAEARRCGSFVAAPLYASAYDSRVRERWRTRSCVTRYTAYDTTAERMMRGTAETRVMMMTSRWRRWPISWARTARISSWFRLSRRPSVTTSSDDPTVRPKTNAFGEESALSQMAAGVGTPAWRARSTTV